MSVTVYILGIVLQAVAGIIALLQLRLAPRKLPWLLIALSSLLIVGRRTAMLHQLIKVNKELADAEVLTLIVSLLFFLGVVLMSRMFRESVHAHETLRESEALLCRSQQIAHVGSWMLDVAANRVTWSDETYRILGLEPQEITATYESFLEFVHPEDRDAVNAAYSGSLREGRGSFEIEHRILRRKTGEIRYVFQKCIHERNAAGIIVRSVGMVQDITERMQAKQALELASAYNRSLIEASLDPLVTIGPDGRITDVNRATEVSTGYNRDDLIGTNFADYFTEPDRAREGYQKVFQAGLVHDYALALGHRDVSKIPVLYNASLYRDKTGQVIGVFAAARDITDLKNVEDALRSSLLEKELLLKEIHHRVKNNLQVVSSLLDLQIRQSTDKVLVEALRDSQHRVRSMALVHEKLYRSAHLSGVNFGDYVKSFTADLFHSYHTDADRVRLQLDVDNSFLPVDVAIPCGLIINELVSNALKHAFPPPDSGTITVSVHKVDSEYVLSVRDTGKGIPVHIDFKSAGTLGLRLVNILAEDQLGGTIELIRENGTEVRVKWKGKG